MVTKDDIIKVLKEVEDPEIGVDIYTLELIYELAVDDGSVYIKMTLTTPFCPYAPTLLDEVKMRVRGVKGVKDVKLDLVFEPRWQPSEELRAMLGV